MKKLIFLIVKNIFNVLVIFSFVASTSAQNLIRSSSTSSSLPPNTTNSILFQGAGNIIGLNTNTPTATLDVRGNQGNVNNSNFKVTYNLAGNVGLLGTEFSALRHLPTYNGWTAMYAKSGSASYAGIFEGDMRFTSSGGGNIQFANPSGAEGLSIQRTSGKLAQIRLDDAGLRILTGNSSNLAYEQGISIKNDNAYVGIGESNPQNKLHIKGGITNTAGVRLSNFATPQSIGKALGADPTTGDVILVDNPTYFSGDGIALSPVGINSFKIDNSFWQTNGSGIKNGNTVNDVEINGIGSTTLNINPTIISAAIGINSNGYNVGVQGNGATGLLGISTKTGFNNYGIRGVASNGKYVFGVHGSVDFPNISTLAYYAIYGNSISGIPLTSGIPTPSNIYAGYFNGDVMTTSSTYFTSDRKLKEKIMPLDNALNIVDKLDFYSYEFKQKEFSQMALPQGEQFGVIADEIEKVFPQFVKKSIHPAVYDKDGNETKAAVEFKAVNYNAFIPVALQAIKEQQTKINDLETRLAKLENVSAAENKKSNWETSEAELFQNTPNPFQEKTEIKYRLPQTTKNAIIYVYDMNGRQIKNVSVQAGEGSVTIESNELSAGMYIYSLVADGKEVSTKRMILTK